MVKIFSNIQKILMAKTAGTILNCQNFFCKYSICTEVSVLRICEQKTSQVEIDPTYPFVCSKFYEYLRNCTINNTRMILKKKGDGLDHFLIYIFHLLESFERTLVGVFLFIMSVMNFMFFDKLHIFRFSQNNSVIVTVTHFRILKRSGRLTIVM